jgi:hypothetical protein
MEGWKKVKRVIPHYILSIFRCAVRIHPGEISNKPAVPVLQMFSHIWERVVRVERHLSFSCFGLQVDASIVVNIPAR